MAIPPRRQIHHIHNSHQTNLQILKLPIHAPRIGFKRLPALPLPFVFTQFKHFSTKLKLAMNEDIKASEILLINEKGEKLGVFDLKEALKVTKEREMDLMEVSKDQTPSVCKMVRRIVKPSAKQAPKSSSSKVANAPSPNNKKGDAPTNNNNKNRTAPATPTTSVAGATPATPAVNIKIADLNANSNEEMDDSDDSDDDSAGPLQKGSKPTSSKEKTQKEIKIRTGIEPHDLGVKLNKVKEFLIKQFEVKLTIMPKPGKTYDPRKQTELLDSLLSKQLNGLYALSKQPKMQGKYLITFLTPKKK